MNNCRMKDAELGNKETVLENVRKSIEHMQKMDAKLFNSEANERAIAHRLAVYLEPTFNGTLTLEEKVKKIDSHGLLWDVDCEYNRILSNIGSPKQQSKQQLLRALEVFKTLQAKNETTTPWHKYLVGNFTADDIILAEAEIVKTRKRKGKPKLKPAGIDEKDSKLRKKVTTPDIVVHERRCGELSHNLLVIEIKPDWSTLKFKTLIDLARLRVFTEDKDNSLPTYQFGLFLTFREEAVLGDCWLFTNKDQHSNPVPFTLAKGAPHAGI